MRRCGSADGWINFKRRSWLQPAIIAIWRSLVKAHQSLDRAVDAAYGKTAFKSEAERVAFLFERYQQLTAPLMPPTLRKTTKRSQS